MKRPADPAARQVARLLRWYPASWRARYGEEFAELLLADLGRAAPQRAADGQRHRQRAARPVHRGWPDQP